MIRVLGSPKMAAMSRAIQRASGGRAAVATLSNSLFASSQEGHAVPSMCRTYSTVSVASRPRFHHRNPFGSSTTTTKATPTSARSYSDEIYYSAVKVGEEGPPPFEKVLIANRGEIVQRIVRTCKRLGVKTVVVYSTADAQASFVKEADEAICIGPAAANQSYLNTDRVLAAVKSSGAQALHPGYGFLSENAKFSQIVESAGCVWLGPPPHAVHNMGDKLVSKRMAEEAGVTTVPGYENAVESLEQALDICNNQIGYPVLLKAMAGGGGKGMRTCYDDQDIREAWKIAKAEALQFFSDDRLLLEKFITNPHHIEFQVLCSKDPATGEIDVLVFPERECSIQRRNQKVIEESPSTLLTPATRTAMASQVKALCKRVKYESAGTVEFLVDGSVKVTDPKQVQKFYFLEMNTRLQVEHPVTESVCHGVDLVKGMLWIGAGKGFPPELIELQKKSPDGLVMPFKGHAMEARIYAEDPLRGFLPSTGPLTPYKEPILDRNTTEAYIRLDSGVAEGHVVSAHYDPMLSKLISFGQDRNQAIALLRQALDEYVIEGVQHNARLVQSVLREPDFVAGDTPTSFLPTHYPSPEKKSATNFVGVKLLPGEKEEFAASVAVILEARRAMLDQPPLGADAGTGEVIVRLGGLFGEAYSVRKTPCGRKAIVKKLSKDAGESKERVLGLEGPVVYDRERCLAHVPLAGCPKSIQVLNEQSTGEIKMQMHGCDMNVMVQSPREYELSVYMHEPAAVDNSSMVLSPMPGTLISYAVKPGDVVQIGQELCIVEAMKMQNIIRSERIGTIAACKVKVGSSLKADEVLIEFVVEEEAAPKSDKKKAA